MTKTITETVVAEPQESISATEGDESVDGGPSTSFGDGTHIVGEDIEPGTYRIDAPQGCYWARLSELVDDSSTRIDNGNATGQSFVVIDPTDKAFLSAYCSATWEKFD